MPIIARPSPAAPLGRNASAWLTLGVVFLATLTLWLYFEAHFAERARERFLSRAESERNMLQSRMQAYEQVLRGAAGLFAASDVVDRLEWRKYIAAHAFEQSLPGILGTGFALMVPKADKAAHEAAVRAEGFPDYRIRPEGERELYSSIIYLEPFEGRNLRAFGYDMFSEPVRREAMIRARDSGEPALSGKVTLVQEGDTDVQAGFLIYLPIYRHGAPVTDVETRRAALFGFVYSPFRAEDMMRAVFGDDLRDVELQLFDREASAGNLLFASESGTRTPQHVVDKTIELGGHVWLARFSSSARFERDTASAEPTLILLGGLTVDLMLFAVMYTSLRHRRRMQTAAMRLAQSRDDFRTLVENVPGVVFRSELDAPRTVLHISRGIEALTEEPPERFMAGEVSFADYIHADDVATIQEAIAAAVSARHPYEVEYRIRSRKGELRWVSERGQVHFDRSGKARWLDGVILDVTERRAAEHAVRNLAFLDPLTHLPNRRFLLDRLRQGLASSARSQRHGALLFVDMDDFKAVNDRHGHEAGDCLLVEVAHRLRDNVREGDTVARLGGDEFVIMLEDLGDCAAEATAKAEHIGHKILAALNAPYRLNGQFQHNTPSIGLTIFCGQEVSVEELLRRADRAMYRAKADGRNRLAVDG